MIGRRQSVFAACSAIALSMLGTGVAGATTVPGCAAPVAGGDWPSYSGNLPASGAPGGNRSQPAEQAITTSNASQLGLAWKLDTPDGGVIDDTPAEVDGCVFVGTDLGTVYALNADTGKVVWQNTVTKDSGNSIAAGAGIVGSPAIANGVVYIGVTATNASIEMALNEATGQTEWQTPIDTDPGGGADSSPVPFDTGGGPMVLQAYQGDESSNHSNPGYDILNADTGAIIYAGKIIPPAAYAQGDRGGSIVDTPAIDVDGKMAYAGTGNPASVNQNHITDSEIKIDLNPASSTFGQILASARGTSDSYPDPAGDASVPTCPATRYSQWPVGPISCLSLDYNFLSTGDLYTGTNGRQMFAELQKSGVMQAVNTSDMSVAWKTTLNTPCLACNGGSTAADANGIYAGTTGGNLFALNKDTGAIKWAVAGTGFLHYNGVSVAGGLVYDINDEGAVEAFNAASGAPVWAHPLLTESGGPYQDGGNSDGISIARDTVYVASAKANGGGSALFAFKVGAGSGGLPPLPSPPPLPGVPAPAQSIVTGPAAANATYATPDVVLPQGQPLNYTNLDTVEHNVVASANGSDGQPLFQAKTEGLGTSEAVSGVQSLPPGTYKFYCSIHPWMTGQIIVQASPVSGGANRASIRKG